MSETEENATIVPHFLQEPKAFQCCSEKSEALNRINIPKGA